MKLDDIHRAHGQPCAIDHTANASVQRNVVQLPLCRMCLALVFLRRIVHRLKLRLAVQGI